jgi:hypothetical protein
VQAASSNVAAWAHVLRHHTAADQSAALADLYRRALPHQ